MRAPSAWAQFKAGSDVGPAYVKPQVETPAAFKESSPAAYQNADPGAWQPAQPQDAALKGKWWEVFGEPELNALEEQLNINNQNIAQFFQNFMAARAQVAVARSNYFPTLTTSPAATRTHASGALGKGVAVNNGTGSATGAGTGASGTGTTGTNGSTFNEFQLPFDVSWEPDLWGRVRNTVRQARYAAQVSAADLENERLTEQASLAEFYFQLRGQDALQDLFSKTIEAQKKSLELTKVLVETGIDSPEDVAQAEVTLANTEATAVGASASETIFDGGLRHATLRQYNAQFNADVAAYRQTVLVAFQQVEDYVSTVRVLSQQIERQRAAVAAAQRFLDIATSRYQTGIDPYLNVITAQTTLLGDQQTEVTLRVSEMTAAVQLIQALGGGWDLEQLPSAGDVTSQKVADRLQTQ